MQNPCAFPATRECLVCKFPPCKCQKCTKLGSEGKTDQEGINRCFSNLNDTTPKETDENPDALVNGTANGSTKLSKTKLFGIPYLHVPTFNFTTSNLQSFLFDIVGIVSFFIIATVMFWVTISQYLWHFIQKIYQWERKTQLIALILLILLCVSITFHAIKGAHRHQHTSPHIAKPYDAHLTHNSTSDKKCSNLNLLNSSKNSRNCRLGSGKNLATPNNGNKMGNNIKRNCNHCDLCTKNNPDRLTSSNSNLTGKQNPSLCDLCAQYIKNEVQPILSDDEARKMYKRFKLYAIPTEMKSPPSISNLFEFLSGLYSGISLANALP